MIILQKEGCILNITGDNSIYNIPFDQYQRYKTTSLIINDLRDDNETFKILEIGANEHKNLERFLPNDIIYYLDIQLSNELKSDIQYILADATNMPEIESDSFDIVIALDVFEHIPRELREKFLLELNRVAKKTVILAGPFSEKGVNEAEVRVNEYFKIKFGTDYIWLEEHIKNGLPSLSETMQILNLNFKGKISHFRHGSLPIWEELIRLHFEVADSLCLQKYRQNIDNFYNKTIFYSDIDKKCYRDFIICSSDKFDYKKYFKKKDDNLEELKILNSLIDSTYRLSNEQRYLNIQNKDQQIQERDQQIQERDQQIQERDQQIQERDQQIQERDQQIQGKDQQIQYSCDIAQSMRIKNRIKRVVKKIIPSKTWKIYKYIKNNPNAIKMGLQVVKTQNLITLVQKIKKVDDLSEERIKNSYVYIEPFLTDDIKQELNFFKKKPLISVIMPVYNVDPKWLDLAIESIQNQWYENWELCIVDDKSTNRKTLNYLKNINNLKIKIKFLEKNVNISVASNEALKLASGEYTALMDNDDELTIDALYEIVKAINTKEVDFIYSDEDKLELDGTFGDPHFKPDFAPDMFLSQNYISHLGVIKKELIDKVGGFSVGLEGSQDYDLYLKVLDYTDKIYHIQKVLYHWRKIPGSTAAEFSGKSYAQEAGRKAIQNAIQRRDIDAKVLNGKYPGTYKVEYSIKNNPLVSIIIPFKDKPELLKMCIESILDKSTYQNFEIIGISNNSTQKETFEEMKRLESLDKRVKVYEYNVPFNYSDINNHAVKKYAKGEHILLLNNDIEIITPEWIEEMLMYSQRESVGVVGAKLYYPNDTIQHAGVIIGIGGIAGHSHKYFDKNSTGYFSRLHLIQNLSAVTAACFMVKKSIFEEVNGLNEEELKVAFNDVDFCLRVTEKGYLNIFTPYCEAYHHESISRGLEDTLEKQERFRKEVEYMQGRHKSILKNGDPYYNPNLTLDREDFSFGI